MKLKLTADTIAGWGASVEIDGVRRDDVCKVVLTVDAHGVNTATITFFVDQLEADIAVLANGEFHVHPPLAYFEAEARKYRKGTTAHFVAQANLLAAIARDAR